jgi:hypothetical protein
MFFQSYAQDKVYDLSIPAQAEESGQLFKNDWITPSPVSRIMSKPMPNSLLKLNLTPLLKSPEENL